MPLSQLLAEARYEYQRVVDTDSEADHRYHEGNEEDEVECQPQKSSRSKCHDNADYRQRYGHECGHQSAEQYQENEEGDRDADALPCLYVFHRQLVSLRGDAGLSGDEHFETVAAVPLADHVEQTRVATFEGLHVVSGLVESPGHDEGDQGRLPVP